MNINEAKNILALAEINIDGMSDAEIVERAEKEIESEAQKWNPAPVSGSQDELENLLGWR